MVHRNKNFLNPPSGLLDPKWSQLKRDLLRRRRSHAISNNCYRDSVISDLVQLYKNKCAICERDRGFELQVDHYRPFKERNSATDPQYNQPGYYWLAYEWSNLIPLCSTCNRKKSNKFQIRLGQGFNQIVAHDQNHVPGFNATCPNWLHNYELPLFINPEIETDPMKHFSYRSNCEMVGRTDEGIVTIEVCDLNRKDLKRQRRELREKYVNRIRTAFDSFAQHRNNDEMRGEIKAIFKDIYSGCHIDSAFSLFNIFIWRYFDYFIDRKLPSNLRGRGTKYFDSFKISEGL